MTYNLVVIGSGAAGMTAAVRAKELGVEKIVILEKAAFVGGNSRMAGGMFTTYGKKADEAGIEYDIEAFYEEAIRNLKFSTVPEIVRKYIYATGKSVDWLAESGLKFETRKMPFGCTMANIESPELAAPYEKDAPTSHSYMGTAVVKHLKNLCSKANIEIRTASPAKELVLDNSGAVIGVRVETKHGIEEIYGDSVVLATGGAAGSIASLHEFFPTTWDLEDENFTFGCASCVGDGIHMAEAIGADTRRAMGVLIKGPSHLGPGGTQALAYSPDSLIVDQFGRRFIDESVVFDYHEALNNIPCHTTYTIVDSTVVEEMNQKLPPQPKPGTHQQPVTLLEGLQQEAASGKNQTYIGDSLEQAAKMFKIPWDTFRNTVAEYNQLCRSGKDELLGKDSAHLKPIVKPPFYVLKGIRSTDSTRGGVTIDAKFHVLSKAGNIIRGLYAIGDIAGGWAAEIYAPNAAGFTWSFNSGFLCGETIAHEINDKA